MRAPIIASLSLSAVAFAGCMDKTSKELTTPVADRTIESSCGSFGEGVVGIVPFCGSLTANGSITVGKVFNPQLFPLTATDFHTSLVAIHHSDGSVSGEYGLRGQDSRIHASITCVGTPIGQVGPFTIGGVIDQSTDPSLLGGDIGIFAAVPDRLSLAIAFFDRGPVTVFGIHFVDIAHAFCAGLPVTSAEDFPSVNSENVSVNVH